MPHGWCLLRNGFLYLTRGAEDKKVSNTITRGHKQNISLGEHESSFCKVYCEYFNIDSSMDIMGLFGVFLHISWRKIYL
jgi:hypothetical protein